MNTIDLIFAKKRILLGCLLMIMSNLCFAQNGGFEKGLSKNWSFNLNTGPVIYWGYFSDSKSITTAFQHGISLGYGIVLTKQISPIFGIRGQFVIGSLKGRKDFYGDGLPANLNFFSDLSEGNISAKISLTNLIRGYSPKRIIDIFGLAGIGISNFKGQVVSSVSGDTLYSIGNKTKKGISGWEIDATALLGAGLNVRLNKYFDLTAETSMQFFKTDKLGRVRGLISYDMYSYSSIGITYKIAAKKKSRQPKVVSTENRDIDVKKDIVSTNIPVKVENNPIGDKKDVVLTAVLVNVENKKHTDETVKKPDVKAEEIKSIEKVVLSKESNRFSGYRIQIIAMLNPISIEDIKQKYKITEQIQEYRFGKWYCYSIGDFQTTKEAKVYAKHLNLKKSTKNAFIVKFINGNRVSPIFK